MRIVSWNLGHQTRELPFKPLFQDAVTALRPDVLVLNEYVHGTTRASFVSWLGELGLKNHEVSTRQGTQNQILIASRSRLECGDLIGPSSEGGGGQSNFLHVKLPEVGVEIVGLRVPAYEQKAYLTEFWQRLIAVITSAADRPIMFIGDFNADPDGQYHTGSKQFAALRVSGWQLPSPTGTRSFKSGTRIDHAVASVSFGAIHAAYVEEVNGISLCGLSSQAISDHAPIVVELAHGAPIS